ncbi:MAG: PLP-dependent aminotransferase family protein [Proteobacteria bacterium]|nr:PLP-dependent aminotransferase family protein [Pseudomonadota bacterium]
MADFTIVLDKTSALGLQDQLRRKIVEAIYAGALRPGRKMPSSRALATDLGVSRNTVVLAYGDLVADGHLETRDRSGIFVSHKSVDGSIVGRRLPDPNASPIADRMVDVPVDGGIRCPQNWRQYPYPFWDGRVEASLVPVQEWRKAVRLASCPRDAAQWSDGNGELDDPILIDELCTKVLPERGINAQPEEVLVTHSMRQALQFLVTLLLRPGMPVWVEEPVDPELLATLRGRGARVERFHPDATTAPPDGVLVVTSARAGVASGSLTGPSRVDAIARGNGVVIELAVPADTLEPGAARPALYASAGSGNVIHVACLSPVAACGMPLAYVVSDASVIARLRMLRRVSGALPNLPQQRAWAYFLALGYYASALHRTRRALTTRKTALRDALNHYLHPDVQIGTIPGVSAYWVRCRDGRDAQALATQAAAAGVLIQPARLDEARQAFSMGVTSIPEARIREGVRALAGLLRASRSGVETGPRRTLSGSALRRALAGRTFLYNTVYGEPCTIEVCRSGELIGMAGYANDDPDTGRWWIDGNRWYRQWDHWAYGEAEGYAIAVEGERLYWYDAAGHLVDKAVILRKAQRRPA